MKFFLGLVFLMIVVAIQNSTAASLGPRNKRDSLFRVGGDTISTKHGHAFGHGGNAGIGGVNAGNNTSVSDEKSEQKEQQTGQTEQNAKTENDVPSVPSVPNVPNAKNVQNIPDGAVTKISGFGGENLGGVGSFFG